MDGEKQAEFLRSLWLKKTHLGLKKDLSLTPEIFGHELLVTGLYIWGRAGSRDSIVLASIPCDIVLYNETDSSQIAPPSEYLLFRLHDLQEFPYTAAVRTHPTEEEE